MTSPNLASSAVALQWSLNETASSGFSIAKGVLRAATTDDVQPIAIMAAEAFGATLPMCQETQMKVEIAAKQSHTRFVRFLKSSIGYSKDDAAYHLASSSAGVRFLGLAAALLCIGDHFRAAQSLEMMIRSSAGADQLLPTVRQLKELLLALEYKLNRVGFADSVLGWGTFLTNHPLVDLNFKRRLEDAQFSPSPEFLKNLVDALRSIDRLGDVSQIKIETISNCHWVVAFVKWCTGEPPMIILQGGAVLVDQKNPQVILFITQNSWSQQHKIEVFHDLGRPSQLWSSTLNDESVYEWRPCWRGMVTIERAFDSLIARFDYPSDNSTPYKAICCLVNTVTYVARKTWINPAKNPKNPHRRTKLVHLQPESSRPSFQALSMYPDDASLNASLAKLSQSFKADVNYSLMPKLKLDQTLRELTFMSEYIKQLDCRCIDCHVPDVVYPKGDGVSCRVREFEESVTQIAAFVIVYALFDCAEPVFVSSPVRPTHLKIVSLVESICTQGHWPNVKSETLLQDALVMIGGQRNLDLEPGSGYADSTWIAEEVRGQVAYFAAFDVLQIREDGCFCLGVSPGKILYEGTSYGKVSGPSEASQRLMANEPIDTPINGDLNCCRGLKLNWHVTEKEGWLLLSWSVKDEDTISYKHFEYFRALNGSVLVSNCPHPETTALSQANGIRCYVKPSHFCTSSVGQRHIRIVPVAGDDELRLFSFLTGKKACVVRGHGVCIACCLDTCRKFDLPYLIL